MTTVLVASCVLMAGLFALLAAWMHGQAYRRAARAELAAGACCLLGAAILPSGQQMLPVLTLALATVLGSASLHAVRVGRG
jgi:hypothetical protein